MKKIIALILSVLMICSLLAACGETKPEGGEVEPLPTVATTDPEPSTDEVTKPTEDETEPENTEPEATDPTHTDKEISLGAMNGGVYTNNYLGVTCTLNENWTFATSEELQELPDNIADMFQDETMADALSTQIFDMKASNVDEMKFINIIYNKASATDRLAYAMLTEEEIVDSLLEQSDSMIDMYAQSGIDVEKIEKVTVTFCGETRTAMLTTASIEGNPYFALQLFDYHLGAYTVTSTFASHLENKTEEILTLFAAVN